MFRTLIINAAREVADAWKDKLIVELGGSLLPQDEAYEQLERDNAKLLELNDNLRATNAELRKQLSADENRKALREVATERNDARRELAAAKKELDELRPQRIDPALFRGVIAILEGLDYPQTTAELRAAMEGK